VRAVAFTPDAPALYFSVYAKLGETDQAFEWLERAYLECSSWMTVLKSDPRFESLRSDPCSLAQAFSKAMGIVLAPG